MDFHGGPVAKMSLQEQWLREHGFSPCQETKILHVLWCGQKTNKKPNQTSEIKQNKQIKEKKKMAVGENETCEKSKHREEKITNNTRESR